MPLVSSVSNLDPASIQTPTVAVRAARLDSVATRRPLERVVTRVSGAERILVWSLKIGCGDPCLRKRGSGFSSCLSLDLTASARRSYTIAVGGGGDGAIAGAVDEYRMICVIAEGKRP